MPVALFQCDGHLIEIQQMLQKFEFHPVGTCCKLMQFTLDGDRIADVQFLGGCNGNLQGISLLVKGLTCQEVISRLQGIKCGNKNTSCPDQFSIALTEAMKSIANGGNLQESK